MPGLGGCPGYLVRILGKFVTLANSASVIMRHILTHGGLISMTDFSRRLAILHLIPRQSEAQGLPADDNQIRARRIGVADLVTKLQAQGFATNLRMVQRDLVFLSQQFPHLVHDGERVGGRGWFWRPGAPVLDVPGLDPALSLTLTLAKALLNPLLPPPLLERLTPYFSAAEHLLATAASSGWAAWKDRVRVLPEGQPLCPATIDPEALAAIQTALLEERQLCVGYQGRWKPPADYLLNPLALVFRGRVIYLIASVEQNDRLRHFALQRFLRAEVLESAAYIPANFDLDAYIASGPFDYARQEGRQICLEIRMEAEVAAHLQETPLAADQVITPEPTDANWWRIRATVLDTDQLIWWLLGFGEQVEVLRPLRLRRQLSQRIRHLAALYH